VKVVTVVGARPQFIKAATLSRVFSSRGVEEVVVHTGQHYDENMSDVFFKEMDIREPKHFLKINSLSHGAMTGQMLEKVETVLKDEKPDVVLVFGDTNSTLAGALAAAKIHIPVAHVEAGLRSFNMRMPEEINRILTDRVSSWLYCPTDTAVSNLENEGYRNFPVKISQPGDVMYDVALYYSQKAKARNTLEHLGLHPGQYFLATVHRAENTDQLENLMAITDALNELASTHPVIVPLHPRTRSILQREKTKIAFTVIDPVGYFDMINLIGGCRLVLTDSGGLQKEAFFFGKPCITMREQTEWTELVDAGVNMLAGANKDKIVLAATSFNHKQIPSDLRLYGTGNAAELIVDDLLNG
jgi:UDP-GlcNAc3NAcA epimerase